METLEEGRLKALHRYGILDTPAPANVEALTRVAALVAGGDAVSVINLIDATRQYQLAATGMACGVFSREESMCAHAILTEGVTQVHDAREDEVYKDNPFVNGIVGDVRMYVSAPLVTPEGYAIGTLCVVDSSPRTLNEDQIQAIKDLAAQVVSLFELRLQYRKLEEALCTQEELVTRDPLTGLANRRLLTEKLQEALQRSRERGKDVAVIFGDLDGFKRLNDTHGHQAGDDALVEIGRRLKSAVRPIDTVGRIGGDEFVVVCEGVSVEETATVLLRVEEAVAAPYQHPDTPLGISVGVVHGGRDDEPDQLLREADARMYEAKRVKRQAE